MNNIAVASLWGEDEQTVKERVALAVGLAKQAGTEAVLLLAGPDVQATAQTLSHYGLSKVYYTENKQLQHFRPDAYAQAMGNLIEAAKPAVVLWGSSHKDKATAPMLAAKYATGITADCTALFMDANGQLIQTRPAYGGNVMADIITPTARPQFATVRGGTGLLAERLEEPGQVIAVASPSIASRVQVISREKGLPESALKDAKIIVAAGKGFKTKADLDMVKDFAKQINAQYAASRPLVEKGWVSPERQIGLSGNFVSPDVLITLGISGSVQFMSAIKGAKKIIAVNTDPGAAIFSVASMPVIADIYDILPKLLHSR